MNLTQKFSELSQDQQDQFNALKNGAELDAFLAENKIELSAEESADILEYIDTGRLPLSDDDMETVAGGKQTQEQKDGRNFTVASNYYQLYCLSCNCVSRNNVCAASVSYSYQGYWYDKAGNKYGDVTRFEDCKCYKCGKTWPYLWTSRHDTAGFVWDRDPLLFLAV